MPPSFFFCVIFTSKTWFLIWIDAVCDSVGLEEGDVVTLPRKVWYPSQDWFGQHQVSGHTGG